MPLSVWIINLVVLAAVLEADLGYRKITVRRCGRAGPPLASAADGRGRCSHLPGVPQALRAMGPRCMTA